MRYGTVLLLMWVLGCGSEPKSKDENRGGEPTFDELCGNGVLDESEECEGDDVQDLVCADFGFADGFVTCTPDCLLDLLYCEDEEQVWNGSPGDLDDDGVSNGEDNCPWTANFSQADGDDDGVGDVCDNCADDPNSSQDDADEDDMGDACDALPFDHDNDRVDDEIDNCIEVPNYSQLDLDDDGVGDACDNCEDDPNAAQADLDEDGIGDICDLFAFDFDNDGADEDIDNCPAEPNHDQDDSDDDGVGDACDNCPWLANGDQTDLDEDEIGDACFGVDSDFDNDGVVDVLDVCPTTYDPAQTDSDDDGIGDACQEEEEEVDDEEEVDEVPVEVTLYDQESNSTKASAQQVTIDSPGTWIIGGSLAHTPYGTDTDDFFVLDVMSARYFTITLDTLYETYNDFDVYVEAEDGSEWEGTTASGDEVVVFATDAGALWVDVRAYAQQTQYGNYTLTIVVE